MPEAEMSATAGHDRRGTGLEWVAGIFLSPARHLREILADTRRNWFTPLLILSVVAVAEVLLLARIPVAVEAQGPDLTGPSSPYQSTHQSSRPNWIRRWPRWAHPSSGPICQG